MTKIITTICFLSLVLNAGLVSGWVKVGNPDVGYKQSAFNALQLSEAEPERKPDASDVYMEGRSKKGIFK